MRGGDSDWGPIFGVGAYAVSHPRHLVCEQMERAHVLWAETGGRRREGIIIQREPRENTKLKSLVAIALPDSGNLGTKMMAHSKRSR